jgi:peroxiredoxin
MEGTQPEEAEIDVLISQARREKAPNLEFTTFDGKHFDVKDYLGDLVVINFWASWCGPCRLEARIFEHAYRKYSASAGVIFVGMAVSDREGAARNFVKEFAISYPNGIDDTGIVSRVWGIFAIPQTFVLDRQGRIASVYVGAITEDEIFDEVLGRLISE